MAKLLGIDVKWIGLGLVVLYLIFPPFSGWVNNMVGYHPGQPYTGPNYVTTTAMQTAQPGFAAGSLQMLLGMKDEFSGATLSSSSTLDIVPYTDLSSHSETVTINAAQVASTNYYMPGSDWYLHTISTVTNKYYDEWYHAHLPDSSGNGGMLYRLVANTPSCSSSAISISEKQVGTVVRAGSGVGTQYWQVVYGGQASLPARMMETQANTHFNILDPTGVSMNSNTGAGTSYQKGGELSGSVTFFKGGNQVASQSNYTALSKQVTFNLLISEAEVAKSVGGMILISSSPPYHLEARVLTVWFSVNSTQLGTNYATSQGWCLAPTGNTPGFTTFYQFLNPIVGTASSMGFTSLGVPIDTTAVTAATALGVGIYIADMQLPSDVMQGSSDAAATFYGAASAVGPSALIGKAFSVNSSNQPSLTACHFRFTTN